MCEQKARNLSKPKETKTCTLKRGSKIPDPSALRSLRIGNSSPKSIAPAQPGAMYHQKNIKLFDVWKRFSFMCINLLRFWESHTKGIQHTPTLHKLRRNTSEPQPNPPEPHPNNTRTTLEPNPNHIQPCLKQHRKRFEPYLGYFWKLFCKLRSSSLLSKINVRKILDKTVVETVWKKRNSRLAVKFKHRTINTWLVSTPACFWLLAACSQKKWIFRFFFSVNVFWTNTGASSATFTDGKQPPKCSCRTYR